MPLPVVVVAFDPSCQQTLSSASIGSDWIRAAVRSRKVRVHWTPAAPVVVRSFADTRAAMVAVSVAFAGRGDSDQRSVVKAKETLWPPKPKELAIPAVQAP